MPVVARSQVVLVEILNSWMETHNGQVLPGTTQGSISIFKDHVEKELILIGTSQSITVNRFLINETMIGWILRAADGSCMLAKFAAGNQFWFGYKAWLGGDLGFTKTVIASTNGAYCRSSKPNEEVLASDILSDDYYPAGSNRNFRVVDRHTNPVKLEKKGHHYLTQEQCLTTFENEFGIWESQRNKSSQTPSQYSSDAVSSLWRIPGDFGTPPPTPKRRPRRPKNNFKRYEAAPSRPRRSRSSSLEVASEISVFPHGRGRPKISELQTSPRKNTVKRRASIIDLSPTPKALSRCVSAAVISPPTLTPAPKPSSLQSIIASSSEVKKVIFHFFLSDETLGAIPKLLTECATPETFNEARLAWHLLGGRDDRVRLLGVKVVIEGVARPIALLWDSESGYERMVEAVAREVIGKAGELNVEVRCISRS